jgi:hypothetical protein
MSTYFNNFPRTLYRFGDETTTNRFQDLSAYVEIFDAIKDNSSAYTYYHVQDRERPDQLSFKLYGTTDYYWTFFAINDHIREQGWPLSNRELFDKVVKDFPYTTITTRDLLASVFKVGETLQGLSSGATATVHHRHIELGQLVIKDIVGTFQTGETLITTSEAAFVDGVPFVSANIVLNSIGDEYLSAHHYEDASGIHVDIDPTVGPGALITEKTHLDRYNTINDALKIIRVLKTNVITQVYDAFNDSLRS